MSTPERYDRKVKSDINFSGTGDNTVISAPGDGKHVEIDFCFLMVSLATTVQLKDGSTNWGGAFPLGDKGSLLVENTSGFHAPIILSNNSSFIINQSGTSQISGWTMHRIQGE